MDEISILKFVTVGSILLFIASMASVVLKRLRFPYTIGLVIVGIGVAFVSSKTPLLTDVWDAHLTPGMILYMLLPILIFDSALHIDIKALVKNILPVSLLAGPGLIISTAIVGLIVAATTPLGYGLSFLFGALISATDPVAVIALFGEVGAPKRLNLLVDGESLFNDATAIVAFRIVMGLVTAGTAFGLMSLAKATASFLFVFFGGCLIGAAIGFIMVYLIRWTKDDPAVETALSTVVAFMAFIVADHVLNVSGVMSTLSAGIVVSWFGKKHISQECREYLARFWNFAAFVCNSFIFILLGLTEAHLLRKMLNPQVLLYLGGAILAILVSRAVVVYGICPLVGPWDKTEKIPFKYQLVLFWGGLRGAVPVALVLSLAKDFPYRTLFLQLTFGIVLFTLLIQGMSMPIVIKKLGLLETDSGQEPAE